MRVSLPMMILREPWLACTFPAAQPNFSTNSGVIGASPTRPRMPSVPKYLRLLIVVISLSCQCGFHHSHGFCCLFYVMDANNMRSLHCCNDRAGQTPAQAVGWPNVKQLTYH